MTSTCTEDFWKAYERLPVHVRDLADKAYRLWIDNQDHPSLNFKKWETGKTEQIWAARVGRDYRALCTKESDVYIWFWIGSKQDCMKL